MRGEVDGEAARRDLNDASGRLADALVSTAASDPEISQQEVDDLRDDLSRELGRLAEADIKASRGGDTSDSANQPSRTAGGDRG